ncbi:MAG: Uncharacterised protein [Formosa sp. Hel1_33_131]|jgi:hypothetical protein|nr:MAG: Uncharacterised protein [Formosa sp. Hel1_33_131]|tara:strand:+ start:5621 stop:6184 length:564 start_codon:yes stop_codon:yes gene_type:complete
MKTKILNLVIVLLFLTSCQSVRVVTDYDKTAQFKTYKTFGFLKDGVDRAEISDLDKRRVLRAIEAALLEKGFTKSETPDLLVNFFTKEKQQVNVYNNGYGGFGYGWGPYYNTFGNGWGGGPFFGAQVNISNSSQGTLYIDLIDAKRKELIWQGIGEGYLTNSVKHKDERINAFVSSILCKYPPEITP